MGASMPRDQRVCLDYQLRTARNIKIQDQASPRHVPFVLNAEQRLMARFYAKHRKTFTLKARQVGASYETGYERTCSVIRNDARGDAITHGLVWNTFENTTDKLRLYRRFLEEHGIPLEGTAREFRLPNGATIAGSTASAGQPFRSRSLQSLHLSELPYWRNTAETYATLMDSLQDGGILRIETTMDASCQTTVNLWKNPGDVKCLFIPLWVSETYRRYDLVAALTERDWEWLFDMGWPQEAREHPDRAASAAWWRWALDNKKRGSEILLKRDFPVIEAHAFALSRGRWVQADPEEVAPLEVLSVACGTGNTWDIELFVRPVEVEGPLYIVVDTSNAVGNDRTTCVAIEGTTGRIVACLADPWLPYDDNADCVEALLRHYNRTHGYTKRQAKDRLPKVLVEENGVGGPALREIRKKGIRAVAIWTDEGSKHEGMTLAKRAVEDGHSYGPEVLAEECRSCVYEETEGGGKGRWKGKKDVLMTIGMGLLHHDRTYKPQQDEPIRNREDLMRRRAEMLNGSRSGW